MVKDSARITTDIPCLAVSLLALLMIEVLLAAQTRRGQALAGVVLGIALWFDCVVRLNGKTVLYMALLAHVIGLPKIAFGAENCSSICCRIWLRARSG